MSQGQTLKTYKFCYQNFDPKSGSIPIQVIGENLHHQTTHKEYKLLHLFFLVYEVLGHELKHLHRSATTSSMFSRAMI